MQQAVGCQPSNVEEQAMVGLRNWRWTVGGAVVTVVTDFWLDYKVSGVPPVITVTLHGCWEGVALTETDALKKRQAVESRLQVLEDLVGRQGTLDIDYGLVGTKQFTKVTLTDVSFPQADNNLMLEYDLQFTWADLPNGVALARRVDGAAINPNNGEPVGTTFAISTDSMLVTRVKKDTTSFKTLWRHVPVRIFNGDDLTVLSITGIRQLITGGTTALLRRQAVETIIANWRQQVGRQFTVLVDGPPISSPGINEGTCHLRDVRPGQLYLPDAVTYDLEFYKDYIS
jgi:hypothetical protein